MKKQFLAVPIIFLSILAMEPVMAGGASENFSEALDHSAQAVALSSTSGLQLVSGAIAIPLLFAAEVGKVSGEIGNDLWDEANRTLPISEDVVTVRPTPAEAMLKEE